MKRVGDSFIALLRSPNSAPHVADPIRIDLAPHPLGGFVLTVGAEHGQGRSEGLATAGDLRELSAMFAAAAAVLEGRRS